MSSSAEGSAVSPVIKYGCLTVVVIIVLAAILPAVFPGREAKEQITRSRMRFDRVRILDYAHEHNQLPRALAALPPLPQKPGTDHHFEDGWGRRILYEVDAAGQVTLKSLGRDGLPGGEGHDADIIMQFPSRKPDGSWLEATYDSYIVPKK